MVAKHIQSNTLSLNNNKKGMGSGFYFSIKPHQPMVQADSVDHPW